MKKLKKLKLSKSKLSTWKHIGILLGLVTLFLLLVNSKLILNNFVASPNINKITEVDSSTAGTDLERKAAEELNKAADKADKAKTEKQKIKTTADLLIAGTAYTKAVELAKKSETTNATTDYDKAKQAAIETLTDPKRGDLGNNVPFEPLIKTDDNGDLTLTETGIKSYVSDSPSTPKSDDKSGDSGNSNCPGVNSGKFGCPYDFSWKGDEKCGNSVAGYYCWGNDKDGYKLYVINLPDTQREYAKTLESAKKSLDKYVGNGSEESVKAYLNSLGIYDTATVKSLSQELLAKNTPPGGNGDSGTTLSDEEKAAKKSCNTSGYVYDESNKKCTLKLLKPLTISEKECHTQHPGYVYGSDGSCKPNATLTTTQQAALLAACKDGLQKLGDKTTYVTCDTKATTTRGIQSYNFCSGGGEYIKDYGCATKGVGEKVHPNGIYTGGESVKPGEESKCIYDAVGGKCNYSTGNPNTKPPLIDNVTYPGENSAVAPAGTTPTSEIQNLSEEEKDKLENPDQPWSNSNPINIPMGDHCPKGSISKIHYKDATHPKNTYDCFPPEAIDTQSTGLSTCNCNPGYMCGEGRNGGECVYDPDSPVNAKPKDGSLESGASCAGKGSDDSCISGDCRYIRNPTTETRAWTCMAKSTFTDNILNPTNGKVLKRKNTYICSKDSDCASNYCADNSLLDSPFSFGSDTCENNPFQSSPAQETSSLTPLNTTSDPAVPQVAQTGTTALDTGPLVSNPVVSNPAGQPAVNVPGAVYTPPNGLSSKGSGNCIRRGNTYCDGSRMYELYSWYRDNDGWWNEDSDLTPAEFTAMMLVAESGGDVALLQAISEASANQLWGSGLEGRGPYCTSQADCKAGVLNFTGAYMESAGKRYNNLQIKGTPEDDLKTWNQYLSQLEKEGITLESIASSIVYDQKPRNITASTPTEWGSSGDPDIAKRGDCPVAFEGGGDVVYSFNQKYTWDNTDCE